MFKTISFNTIYKKGPALITFPISIFEFIVFITALSCFLPSSIPLCISFIWSVLKASKAQWKFCSGWAEALVRVSVSEVFKILLEWQSCFCFCIFPDFLRISTSCISRLVSSLFWHFQVKMKLVVKYNSLKYAENEKKTQPNKICRLLINFISTLCWEL